jgi:flagellar motor switch protein FliN/FliY
MQQWLIEAVEQRLQTVFAALIPGARLHYASGAGAPTSGEPWMWWQQTFRIAPSASLSVGLSAAAVAGISAAVQQGGLLGTATSEEAANALLRILANACAAIVPGFYATAGPLNAGLADAPGIFSLEFDADGHHTVAVALSPALVRIIEAESQKDLPEAGPALLNLDLPVSISLGRARLEFRELLRLSTGSVVELDRMLGESVDVTINGSVIARGEIVVVEGNYGVRIQDVSGAAWRSVAGFPASL